MDTGLPELHAGRMRPGVAILAVCAVIVLVGCAARQTTAPTVSGAAAPPSSGVSSSTTATNPPTPISAPSASERAAADADAILASFRPPQGARRLTGPPAAAYGTLGQSDVFYPGPDVADRGSWWLVPGQPGKVLSWVRVHLPSRFMFTESWVGGTGGTVYTWGEDFWLPPIPGVLDSRVLVAEVVNAGGGQTAIRVDGQVAWQPSKTVGELVPPAARTVTVTGVPESLPGPPPAQVTITDVTRVRWMAALVDGLPYQAAPKDCVMRPLGNLRLTFRARSGGPALAEFTGDVLGCYGLLSVDGKTIHPAGEMSTLDDGNAHVIAEMLAVSGMRWPAFTAEWGK